MNRTADDLLDRSFKKKLNVTDLNALINCMKVMPNLIKEEKEAIKEMSDEELSKIAAEEVDEED